MKNEIKCEKQQITTIRTSSEPHLEWKKHFHRNPTNFRILANLEAFNEIDLFSTGNKTTNVYKQNPVCNGFYIVSELNDVLRSGYCESFPRYDTLDWFEDE